jgi:hypothetical protein
VADEANDTIVHEALSRIAESLREAEAERDLLRAERDDLAGQVAMLRSRLSVTEGTHVR